MPRGSRLQINSAPNWGVICSDPASVHQTGELQGQPAVRRSSSPKNNRPLPLPRRDAEPSSGAGSGRADPALPLLPPHCCQERRGGAEKRSRDAAGGDVAVGSDLKAAQLLLTPVRHFCRNLPTWDEGGHAARSPHSCQTRGFTARCCSLPHRAAPRFPAVTQLSRLGQARLPSTRYHRSCTSFILLA